MLRTESRNWTLLKKIGSGDAGEVWRVEAEGSKELAVLKRPEQNVSGGTSMRQAMQIEAEGQILADLNGIDSSRNNIKIHTPLLIDQSIPGTSGTSGLFMISEEVSGVSITELLDQLRQGESAFSQVLTLKVLAASFHLLRQVHAKGILWNDVKMDHIFWDEEANKMSFIDWGNGLRFDPEAPDGQINPSLDFQQLIDEGRQLLNQISPDLLVDLGWPVSAKGLSDLDIFHLQMRVEYLENHLAMRVIEYQLLFSKYLQSASDVESLRSVFELKKALERLGVEVQTEPILESASQLWYQFLENDDAESGYKLIQLLEENLALPPHWQLAIYFFRSLQKSQHDTLSSLLKPTLEEKWSEAMWAFQKDFHQHFSEENSRATLNTMRKLADSSKDSSVILPDVLPNIQKELQQNIQRLKAQNAVSQEQMTQLETLENHLSTIQNTWPSLADKETLGEKLLAAREVLAQLAALGLNIPPNYQLSLTALLSKIREVYRAWANAELDQTHSLLRELFLLDPNLAYLHVIDEDIEKTSEWVETLKDGPQSEQTVNAFGQEMLETLPKAHLKLGVPGWLSAMVSMAERFQKCQDLNQMREQLRQVGMPFSWADYSGLNLEFLPPGSAITTFSATQEAAIRAYHHALANKNDASVELNQVKANLPNYHFLYAQLNERFQQAWALQAAKHLEIQASDFPPADNARIEEAFKVLDFIKHWRQSVQTRLHAATLKSPEMSEKWIQITEIQNAQEQWQETILPVLGKIKQKDWDPQSIPNLKQAAFPNLQTCQRNLAKLSQGWRKIENQGIFEESLADMSAHISQAQSAYYRFWQTLDTSSVQANRWLAMVYQPILSEINQNMLLIMRHLQSVMRAMDVLNTSQMARTRLALNSAGELMFTLVQLNDLILPPSRDFNLYRHWRQQYLDLLQEGHLDKIRENIQSIESIHPLLPWLDELLRRDTDYFKVPDQQRW